MIVKIGDLTKEKVDAIVNAANSTLLGGGGVDGAIHAAGGPSILEECKKIRQTSYPDGLPTGQAVITSAGRLPAKFVIHTVGPIYGNHGGREAYLLGACYRNCLALADKHSLKTIAFPAISTGVYAYPRSEAAAVSSSALSEVLRESGVSHVALVFHTVRDLEIFVEHCIFPR